VRLGLGGVYMVRGYRVQTSAQPPGAILTSLFTFAMLS
jgi:hypothetical protein